VRNDEDEQVLSIACLERDLTGLEEGASALASRYKRT
jgi:hypothetical protein